jgi:hypothetical protein
MTLIDAFRLIILKGGVVRDNNFEFNSWDWETPRKIEDRIGIGTTLQVPNFPLHKTHFLREKCSH